MPYQYQFQATDTTVEALRRLRAAWRGFSVSEMAFVVTLEDGSAVRVQVEGADVEDAFEAFRIEAFADSLAEAPIEEAGDLAAGANDVVIFTGAAWSESGARTDTTLIRTDVEAPGSAVHFSGHPGQIPESAEVVCLTTDALVVASGAGTGLLVRTGLKPYSLDVIRDKESIAAFLRERSYQPE